MEESLKINPLLVKKYDQPVPRYTSYPTVPYWDQRLSLTEWEEIFKREFDNHNHTEGISIYIHLPFCESLCTFCGCNKKITTNHKVEAEYLAALQKEWKLYRRLMQQTPVIRELHLGGGTPTFFSPENLQRLVSFILKDSIVHPVHEFSIEGHPNNTTAAHLEVLYNTGFRRISFGVQDNNPEVQRVINRHQPFEQVKLAGELARKVGFTSINFDLIYGLPKQTIESIETTIKEVITLRPDRIAFYSYAHVPWTSKAQRLFDENDLPDANTKIGLYLKGKELLMQHGYYDIGMDHFALPNDSLYKAWQKGKLHRNFMGYTTQNTGLLLGLGVSAISDTGTAFAQNEKSLHDYYTSIEHNKLAISKGYILTDEDKLFRKNILDISCKGVTSFSEKQTALLEQYTFPALKLLAADGLVSYDKTSVNITEQGHYFIRNICSAFDVHLNSSNKLNGTSIFSKAI